MAAPKAYSTINTVLKAGATVEALSQLTKIKSYPDLGGTPDNIETTDLEDVSQTFVPGVQSIDNMEFTANYTPEGYAAVAALVDTELYYQIEFGEDGDDGIFRWTGKHSVYVTGGDVNAVREMVISVMPSSSITMITT